MSNDNYQCQQNMNHSRLKKVAMNGGSKENILKRNQKVIKNLIRL